MHQQNYACPTANLEKDKHTGQVDNQYVWRVIQLSGESQTVFVTQSKCLSRTH
uniref:Uncharacterized protein n=1 Tax=Rhizophora mucronata TaxID=61149 RepID=A0A2P2PUE1_RHIMU